jgi:hypothetical protein
MLSKIREIKDRIFLGMELIQGGHLTELIEQRKMKG